MITNTGSSTLPLNEAGNQASGSVGDDEATCQTAYCYSRLSEKGSIRLLRLMPHEDQKAPIQCQIVEYHLQKPGQGTHLYEALSYVWGSEKHPQPIYIQPDGESNDSPTAKTKQDVGHHSSLGGKSYLLITKNLHTALSYLRNRFLERVMWIDAICINQKDSDEKGQQVQSMAKIYTNAIRVVVWLGEAAGGSDQALEVLRQAAEEQHEHPAIDEPNQQAIFTLLKRPWFQRIWVRGR
jgi:hypothetical protein